MSPAFHRLGGRARRWLTGLVVAALTGCYTYAPIELEAVRPSAEVRLRLTATGVDRLEAMDVDLLQGADRTIRGFLEEIEGSQLRVRVPVGTRQDGARIEEINQIVLLPVEDVRFIEEKHFHRGRTILVSAAVAAVGAGIVYAILSGALRRPGDRPEPNPDETILPLGASFPR